MYELAKVSLNNRGNEIKSCERRSLELRNHTGQTENSKENQPLHSTGLADNHVTDENVSNGLDNE